MSGHAPGLTVIVPTRGDPGKLTALLGALSRQTLPRDRYEILISFDGVAPDPALSATMADLGARAVMTDRRRGPGAARNLAARHATREFLAFTEDDCVPADDWLARAAARLESDPAIDVLEGATTRPDGRPSRRPDGDWLHYLPTNLFVRRSLFEDAGGYCEEFFDAKRGTYFREDSDLGFTLEERGAKAAREPAARVVHPREHAAYWEPIAWARRYEMDPLLMARHPDLFRERIEVHRLGPITLRRVFVRSCFAYVIAFAATALSAAVGDLAHASAFAVLTILTILPMWAKWGFNPLRLPVVVVVPFVLIYSYALGAASRAGRPGGP